MNKDIKEQLDILKEVKADIKQSIINRKQEVPDDSFSTLVESCIAIDGDDFNQFATNKDMNASIAKKDDNALVYSKDTNTLGGLYKHNGTTYNAVPTSFTANKNLVYGGNYMGSTGVETGTMNNFTPHSQSELYKYLDILNNINENGVILQNSTQYALPTNLSIYPTKIFLTSTVRNLYLGYNIKNGLENIKEMTISSLGGSGLRSISSMCRKFNNATKLDLSGLLTDKVTNMSSAFVGCSMCAEIDISNFDTSKVTDFSSMFSDCTLLKTLKAPVWNTSSATTMTSMFNGCCELLDIDEHISTFDTSNVIDMFGMLSDCSKITTFSVSHFNTSSLKNAGYMFDGCSALVDIDISTWDMSKVTNIGSMFSGCGSLSSNSLSNILAALPTATSLSTSNRTLRHIGLSKSQTEICTTLDGWQECVNAGWVTGY